MIQNALPLEEYLPRPAAVADLPAAEVGPCLAQKTRVPAQLACQHAILELASQVNVLVRTLHNRVLNPRSKMQTLSN